MSWHTPETATAGELTSTFWNQNVRDNFDAIGDAWTSYTPTLANVTLGNGTITGAYTQAGKLIQFRAKLVLGSTSSITGSPTFTLPVTAFATRLFTWQGVAYDTSASDHHGLTATNTTTTVVFRYNAASLSSTVPFTWATGDELYASGTYEAA